jgi:hypothetical protein
MIDGEEDLSETILLIIGWLPILWLLIFIADLIPYLLLGAIFGTGDCPAYVLPGRCNYG